MQVTRDVISKAGKKGTDYVQLSRGNMAQIFVHIRDGKKNNQQSESFCPFFPSSKKMQRMEWNPTLWVTTHVAQ